MNYVSYPKPFLEAQFLEKSIFSILLVKKKIKLHS
jgi:hypothetical protein